ncbi:MAG: cyclic nucleotide-binding domain-containing protein [bacterium]
MTPIPHPPKRLKIPASLEKGWKELCQNSQEIDFKKGQVLFYEGHQPYGVFVLQSGELEFSQGGRHCNNEHYWSSHQGKAIGMKTFLKGSPYSCTCVALTDCRTLFITKTQLMPFLMKNPEFL